MKHLRHLAFSIALLCAAACGAARLGWLPGGTPLDYFSPKSTFTREWSRTLQGCPDARSAQTALRKNKEGGTVVMMDDGTWVAVVMEHACCTGAGFNATLYRTSRGALYLDSDSSYCGFFPLREELLTHACPNTAAFLESVKSGGKNLVPLRG